MKGLRAPLAGSRSEGPKFPGRIVCLDCWTTSDVDILNVDCWDCTNCGVHHQGARQVQLGKPCETDKCSTCGYCNRPTTKAEGDVCTEHAHMAVREADDRWQVEQEDALT